MKAWGEKGRRDFPERKKSLPGGLGSWIMTKGDFFGEAQTFVKIFSNKIFRSHIIFSKYFIKIFFFFIFFEKMQKIEKSCFFQKKKVIWGTEAFPNSPPIYIVFKYANFPRPPFCEKIKFFFLKKYFFLFIFFL